MIRPTCFLPWGDGYTPPTPSEVREFLRTHQLTGAEAGSLIGQDSRSIRRYTGGDRVIPYAAWRLLVLEVDPQAAEDANAERLFATCDTPPADDPEY